MTILTFKYTKSATDVTNRVVIPLVQPTDKYFTIDVSDLDIEDQALVDAEVEKAKEDFNMRINYIMTDHDIRTNFRSFLPTKMSEMVVEE
jgi:hypothetical protein